MKRIVLVATITALLITSMDPASAQRKRPRKSSKGSPHTGSEAVGPGSKGRGDPTGSSRRTAEPPRLPSAPKCLDVTYDPIELLRRIENIQAEHDQKLMGTVEVRVLVDESGSAKEWRVDGRGEGRLLTPAVSAAMGLTFRVVPAKGPKCFAWVTVPISFDGGSP